jgi:putative ABC transport system permease protein
MMMMQLGFRDALFDSTTLLHVNLRGDLVMLSKQYESLIAVKSFTRRRLQQAVALPSVQSVTPIYVGVASWKNPETMRDRDIFAVGIDPGSDAINLPGLRENLAQTKLEDVVLFDSGSRSEFGPIAQMLREHGRATTEIAGHRIHVAGQFKMGTSFAADGNIVTSDLNFLRIFNYRNAGMIDIGMIRLAPGTDVRRVREELTSVLPQDVRIVTRSEFISLERSYWANRTPIGFVIMAGMIVGFVVGSVIVYQILYTDVIDHLKEYATLKAIGYTDSFLFGIVLQEAVILSVLGFLPACLVSVGIFHLTREMTLLPAYLTFDRAVLVLTLTLLMCGISGACAMQKLKSADPAEIF